MNVGPARHRHTVTHSHTNVFPYSLWGLLIDTEHSLDLTLMITSEYLSLTLITLNRRKKIRLLNQSESKKTDITDKSANHILNVPEL